MATEIAFGVPVHTETLMDDFSELHRYNKLITANGDPSKGLGMINTIRFLDDYKLFDIKDKLTGYFKRYAEDILGCDPRMEITMTTSWLTYQKKNSANKPHKHMNCWYSGILYYDSDYTGSSILLLENPLVHVTQFTADMDQRFSETSDYNIYPKKNLVVFFPSYIYHSTSIHLNEKDRHSLAFNFLPKKMGIFEKENDSSYDINWLNS